ENERDGSDVFGRGRWAVVTRGVVAVERRISRHAREVVVRATVALMCGGVADRARLDERPAGAARTASVSDAALPGLCPADADSRLAGTGRTITIRCARAAAVGAPARVIDTDPAGSAVGIVGALPSRCRPAAASARQQIAIQEQRGLEVDVEDGDRAITAVGRSGDVLIELVHQANAGRTAAVTAVGE